jgi:hypothetical protein
LHFNFALENAIRGVQAKQEGLKLRGTYQVLLDVENVNISGGNIHTLKKKTQKL